jgi:hypothetical protein
VNGSGVLQADSGGIIDANTSMNVANLVLASSGHVVVGPSDKVTTGALSASSGVIGFTATGPGTFGKVVSSTSVAIGSLSLTVTTGSYMPACGTSFVALKASAVSGTIAGISGGPLPSGGSWKTSQTSTSVTATVVCS